MPASLHEWITRLKNQPLPALAHTVQRVSGLMGRPTTTNADYHRIVARDPGFALSIFRHLGNLPKPPREPIVSIAHAVALAGLAPLEAGVKNLPVIEDHSGAASHRGLLECYSRAAHGAMYLSQWAESRKDSNPEELMLAALLHDCGEMALWSGADEQMTAIEIRIERGLSRENAALAVLGFSLTQLSLGLAEAWRLPPLIGEALSPGGAFRPRPLGIMLACELARYSQSTWDSEQTMELIELAAEYCRQTPDQAAAALHSQSAETARQLQGLHLPVSATELLQLQPETAAALQEAITSEVSPAAEQNHCQPGSSSPTANKQVQVPAQTGGSLQIQLTRTMKLLRENAGLERSMFAMLTPDRKSLRVRFVIGAEKVAAIKTFQVTMEKRHIFSILMSKSQSFWLNSGNRKKYLPLIPLDLHNALNTQGFFVSSLFMNEKAIGILYADCSNTAKLNNESFTYFKQLTQQLSADLSGNSNVQATGSL